MTSERKTTPKGYVRINRNKRLVFEHVMVWEKHHGHPVPDGMQIHHKDFNKTNNHIDNLQLVTPLEHKRLHEGCIMVGGEWLKPCKDCGAHKPCTNEHWYFSRGLINGKLCKPCFIKKSLEIRKTLIAKGWKRKNYVRTSKSS
jgi:hypothetical protein